MSFLAEVFRFGGFGRGDGSKASESRPAPLAELVGAPLGQSSVMTAVQRAAGVDEPQGAPSVDVAPGYDLTADRLDRLDRVAEVMRETTRREASARLAQGRAHEAALTDAQQEKATAIAKSKSEGIAEGRAAERARIAAILDDREAEQRPAAAKRLAFSTEMPAEDVVKLLASFPREQKRHSMLDEAMRREGHADLGPGGEPRGDASAAASWNKVVAKLNAENRSKG